MKKEAAAQIAKQTLALHRSLEEWALDDEDLPPYLTKPLEELQTLIRNIERRRIQRASAAMLSEDSPINVDVPKANKRELAIDVLKLLGRPASPKIVSYCAAALYGIELAASQFASMRKGDERAYRRGRRSKTFLVPALSATDLAARPRLIAISDWTLSNRVIGTLSERVNALLLMRSCIELQASKNVDLSIVIRSIASNFNLYVGSRHTLADVLEYIEHEVERIGEKDSEQRIEAARRLDKLPEPMRLFGAMISLETGIDD